MATDRVKAFAIAGLGLACLTGCGSTLPTPSTTLHSGDGFTLVPFPPPVARVEFVSPQADPSDVWLDGSWEWASQQWGWRSGRWEAPPSADARYAPGTCVRSPNGPLYFYPGRWYRADGTAVLAKKDVE